MVLSFTKRYISFHKDFYCIGFDTDKVKQGIEDKSTLSENYNKGMVASKKIFYKDVNMTKQQVIENNETYSQYPVI